MTSNINLSFLSQTPVHAINHSAPVVCKKRIFIQAPVNKVWSMLTDIDHWADWQKDITKSKLHVTLQPGSTFDWKSNGVTIHSTIKIVEINHEIGWTGKSMGLYAIHNWMLRESNGQTEVIVEESMQGLLASLFSNMFNKNLERGLTNWLDFLKKECEK